MNSAKVSANEALNHHSSPLGRTRLKRHMHQSDIMIETCVRLSSDHPSFPARPVCGAAVMSACFRVVSFRHLRERCVDQAALGGQAHERCAALGAAEVCCADWTSCFPAAGCERRLVLNKAQHRPAWASS